MNGRKRTIQIKFRVTTEERALIEKRMAEVPTQNMEGYSAAYLTDSFAVLSAQNLHWESNQDFVVDEQVYVQIVSANIISFI